MIDYLNYISVSVLKDSVDDSKCERSPILKHIIQEKIAEGHNARNSHNPTRGKKFHDKYFKTFGNGLKKCAEHDMVALQLLNLRRNSKRYAINPIILSEGFHITGTPDFYLKSADYARVVELKNRRSSTFSDSDKIQVGAYVTILKDPWFRSTPRLHCRGKDINGYVLFNDGVLKKVSFIDEDLIKAKALEILGKVDDYQINNILPKPKKCNPYCENIVYCNQIGGVIPYESPIAISGRPEIESSAYRTRA